MKKLFLGWMVFLTVSCNKDRSAVFTLEKINLFLGEKAVVSPEYENVDNYKWDFGDESKTSDEENPEPHLYEKEGNFTITLTASHKRNFNKAVTHSQSLSVISWTIDSIRVNSIPNFNSWDSNTNGPDMKIKINDPTIQFQNLFTADFVAYYPSNLDTSQLPVTVGNMNARLYYTTWTFALIDDDLPLPGEDMKIWSINPYTLNSTGSFKLDGGGFDLDVFYKVNY